MKLKILALALMVALLTSSFTFTVFAQEPIPDTEPDGEGEGGETGTLEDSNAAVVDPEVLEALRSQTQIMYQELLGYFGDETLSPAVNQTFRHGQDAVMEGDSKKNTQAAAQMYLRAMKQFRNALRKHLHENPGALDDFEPGNAMQPEPDLDATTSEEIEAAREELILRFQEHFRERLTLMYANLDNMTGSLSEGDAVKARNTIQEAEEKLLRIQERIDRGEFDEAVDELDNATDTMDEGFGGMEDAFAGQMLRTMNKLEAKVQRLVEKQERKAARGEDTSELDGLIEELKGNINRGRNEVNNGQGNSGQGNGGGKPDDKGKPDKGNNGNSGN